MLKKVLIVEDNARGAALLEKKLLKNFSDALEVVDIVGTVEDAIQAVQKHEPELLFLDIHLMDGDGFEVLEQTMEQNYEVIFTTAYGEYSLKAFDYAALHYLMKPIEEADLVEATQRFLDKKRLFNQDQIQLLKQLLKGEPQQIAVPSTTEIVFVELSKIVYFEADSNYSTIYFIDNTCMVSTKSLLFYDELLSESHFYRIHGKYLINIQYVEKYIRGKGGSVEMKGGAELPVAVRRKPGFMNKMLHPY